tara:strand:- start:3660 stop:4373 length:714 start_codon:yes stop_codon:yes gene_type:complete
MENIIYKDEMFVDIPSYEGIYQISNYGRVKSFYGRGRMLRDHKQKSGYHKIILCRDKIHKTYRIHQLVAMGFKGHIPDGGTTLIDHLDNDKSNNHVDNLQITNYRVNNTKDVDKSKTSSKYYGVCWHKNKNVWQAYIDHKRDRFRLGYYKDEEAAKQSYSLAVRLIESDGCLDNHPHIIKIRSEKHSSSHTGIHYEKRSGNWIATKWIDGRSKFIGSFKTELEAKVARDEFVSKLNK